MKTFFKIAPLIALLLCLTGCPEKGEDITSKYIPVFIERSELEKAVRILDPKPIIQGGKIATINNYILLVDIYKGVHIIDNSDVYNPKPFKYLVIPGVKDISMKDGIVYANSSTDLIAFDITNLNSSKVIDRRKDFFKEPLPPDVSEDQRYALTIDRPTDTSIILAWQLKNGDDEEFHF